MGIFEIGVTEPEDRYHSLVSLPFTVLSNIQRRTANPCSLLKKIKGDSKHTITLWVKIADEQGFEALKAKKPTGRPPKLTKEKKAEIQAILAEDDPKKYGQNVWDGSSLSAYIKKIYAVKLSVCQCKRRFHSLGLSPVRPQIFPGKGEENEQERTEYTKAQRASS